MIKDPINLNITKSRLNPFTHELEYLEVNGDKVELAVNKEDVPSHIYTATLSDGESTPSTLAIYSDCNEADFDDFVDAVKIIYKASDGARVEFAADKSAHTITIGATTYSEFGA